MKDPRSAILLSKYTFCSGCEVLVKGEWAKGDRAANAHFDLGVEGSQGRVPVFHVTATEKVCLADWMGGKLPHKEQ